MKNATGRKTTRTGPRRGSGLPAPPTPTGDDVRRRLRSGPLPCIGVYDVFSATLAARRFPALFLSGFGFAASAYGLPDIGFVSWPDMIGLAARIRAVAPGALLVADMEEGYGDSDVAAHAAGRLEDAGVAAVVIEDQRRPRRCGHYEGKQLDDLPACVEKLRRVLAARRRLFVIARTDAVEPVERCRRARAYAEAGADAVMAEAVPTLAALKDLYREVGIPLVCNQIAGGRTPVWSWEQMARAGVRIVLYSTPCLFAAQAAVEQAMSRLEARRGRLDSGAAAAGLARCTTVLYRNLAGRNLRSRRR